MSPARSPADWVAHLRSGGTTPWPAFRDGAPADPAGPADPAVPADPALRRADPTRSRAERMTHAGEAEGPVGARHADPTPPRAERTTHDAGHPRHFPGAQQLELLRRLTLAAGQPVPAALADRVLSAGTTGRGHPDLDLVGAAGAPDPRGDSRGETRGVDPTALPAEELLRVAVGLLAEDLAATPPPTVEAPVWSVLLRRRYRVVGDPRLADPVREELARRGRTIGGRDARVLVLGTGTEQMLADAWVSRFLDVGAPPWTAWLAEWAGRDAVPTRVDLAAAARTWAGRAGTRRLVVVLDPTALPRLVRSRTLPAPPDPVPAHAAELARRVAEVLGLLVEPRRREVLVGRTLLPWVAAVARRADPLAPPPGVPPRLRPWLERSARRLHDEVFAGGYPVVGDPERLLDDHEGVVPTTAGALDVAIAALLGGGPADLPGGGPA
ncbi:hypothetical protein [Nocardioides perillae]|uniref:Uncharacterized protein n=1 Tax=Nocardioides perillae TaxID=1119534 RepID=A0A7Y9RPQ5_9ACTN|nr:hypothetical protein [Nocardioides perillae]NYG54276.1 hypothetical protein [Nocardioides perillae]